MMRRRYLRRIVVILAPSLIMLAGCIGGKSQRSRFYVLSPLPSETGKRGAVAERGVAIGVGPVSLPSYLDRPEIVTRAGGNELHLSEFDRWAEPLEENFSRVLAENLAILIPTDRMAVFPWEKSPPIEYQVVVEVTRFEGYTDGNSVLVARWSIFGADGKQELLTRQSTFTTPIGTLQNYEVTVSALSRSLADLSREIAAEVTAIAQTARKP